jgi:hypothetical protein
MSTAELLDSTVEGEYKEMENDAPTQSFKYPFHLEQAILNSIVRYNLINKSKNVFFKNKNFKDENVRDKEIRAVLDKILTFQNLGSYTVVSAFSDAYQTHLTSTAQLVSGDYNRNKLISPPEAFSTPSWFNRFRRGGKTHRRKRKGRGKKSRKH